MHHMEAEAEEEDQEEDPINPKNTLIIQTKDTKSTATF